MSRPRAHFARLCCVFASLHLGFEAAGANWYVSTTGSDSANGSLATPYATIGKAVTSASAGDSIFLRGGTYNLTSTINISKSGTAALPFTLQNYANEAPVLSYKGQSVGGSSRGMVLSGSYWRVQGFTIEYAGDNGMLVAGSNNVIQRMVARQNNDSGFSIQSSGGSTPSNNLILNCDSYGNYDNQGSNFGENADGFAAKFRGLGPGNVLRGNRAWNNSDDGYDFWQAENGILVENCWAFRNGKSSLFLGLGSFNGDGNGFKLGHDSGTHLLRNNLAWSNPANGIDVNGNATQLEGDPPTIAHGVTIHNNTAFNNGSRNFLFDEDPTTATPATNHILRNNLSITGSTTVFAGNTHDHNTWNAGLAADALDFLSLVDPVTDGLYHPATDRTGAATPTHATGAAVGPRQEDGSLPIMPFLRLAWGSNLINAGVDVGLPYNYSLPDLGAFEAALPGDANLDGAVDITDLAALATNWQLAGNWVAGDFDFNGFVDISDLAILATNWQTAVAGASFEQALASLVGGAVVPEPACAGLLLAGMLLLHRRPCPA